MARKKKTISKMNHAWRIVISLTIMGWAFIGFIQSGTIGLWTDHLMNLLFGIRRDVLYLLIVFLLINFSLLPDKWSLKLRQKFILSINVVLLYLWTAYFVLDGQLLGQELFNSWLANMWTIFSSGSDAQSGLLGVALYSLSTYLLGRLGTLFLLMSLSLGMLLYLLEFKNLKKWFTKEVKPKKTDISEFSEPYNESVSANFMTADEPKVTKNIASTKSPEITQEVKTRSAATIHTIGNYSLPSTSLLEQVNHKAKSTLNSNAAQAKGQRLLEILNEFGVNATLVATHIGPSVTKFEVRPDSNVKISKINSIQDNLKMELAAKELRLEAPIPGRNAVGIEIPN